MDLLFVILIYCSAFESEMCAYARVLHALYAWVVCDKIGAAAWLFCIFTAVFLLRTQREIALCFVYTMYVLDVSVYSFSLLTPPCHRA